MLIHMVSIDEAFCDYEVDVNYEDQMRGVKDAGLFSSALNEPKKTFDGIDLYPTILHKASCYLRSFSMNHPFYDGNKRTALLATIVFLEMNGYKIIEDNQVLYKFVERVVRGRLNIESIHRRLKKMVNKCPKVEIDTGRRIKTWGKRFFKSIIKPKTAD